MVRAGSRRDKEEAKKYIFRPVEKLWRAENREGRYKKE